MEFFHGFRVDEMMLSSTPEVHGAEHKVVLAKRNFHSRSGNGFVKNFSHDSASIVSGTGVGTVTACFKVTMIRPNVRMRQ